MDCELLLLLILYTTHASGKYLKVRGMYSKQTVSLKLSLNGDDYIEINNLEGRGCHFLQRLFIKVNVFGTAVALIKKTV